MDAFLKEIEHLLSSDFPHEHSQDALDVIKNRIKQYRSAVDLLTVKSDLRTVHAASAAASSAMAQLLPLLGFILRSTNVRNTFEAHRPIHRLAMQILGPNTKLVFSSEWNYSPHIWIHSAALKDFAFIGFPVPESSNPLLLPLAGHELGHSLWFKRDFGSQLAQPIEDAIIREIKRKWKEYKLLVPNAEQDKLVTDFMGRQDWEPALFWALKQAEESFCDFVGLRIFGEAYLHAFAYLISPDFDGERSTDYPPMNERVKNMLAASDAYGFYSHPGYPALFADIAKSPYSDGLGKFLLDLADFACASIITNLISTVEKTLTALSVAKPSKDKIDEIYLKYRRCPIPADNVESLSNIINAAWRAYNSPDLWEKQPYSRQSLPILYELVIKNIEVLDYEFLVAGLK